MTGSMSHNRLDMFDDEELRSELQNIPALTIDQENSKTHQAHVFRDSHPQMEDSHILEMRWIVVNLRRMAAKTFGASESFISPTAIPDGY